MGTTVTPYETTVKRFKVTVQDATFDMSEEEINWLHSQLNDALGKPPIMSFKGCGDRMSHGSHAWGKHGLFFCTGRSFDAT